VSEAEPVAGAPIDDPVDRLIVQLRAYVHGKAKSDWRPDRQWTSGLTLTFDTETTADPSQRLRFGAYQLRHDGGLIERGVFHADDMPEADLSVLRDTFEEVTPSDDGERLMLRTLSDFIEHVFFEWGFETGGLIVGFNLPFDLSRIATRHTWAKGHMKGGFSFTLADDRPNVRVKHLSQRSAFINFGGKDGDDHDPDRGFFVDVKTLAATLTGQSHSLKSLAKLLKTKPKSAFDAFDGPVTPEMVRYGMDDVQVTWECFAKLAERYQAYGLKAGMNELYSEASLGKAFLEEMNVQPWRQAQPTFPPHITGQIMSTYYGGRAEVHIRRRTTPVIHCDFLSMYPTVCTLMGLWWFVIADGVNWTDDTDQVRRFVDHCTLDDLQSQQTWRSIACIVQVKPDRDIFPVRAEYEADQSATIGLNRLSADEPMWFTLADVLAAKLLGGKTPDIVSAIRFEAMKPQATLRPIKLEDVELHPRKDDFYRRLIIQRRAIQKAEGAAAPGDKPALNAAQKGLKILANSTSYGIFVEINVRQLEEATPVTVYDFRGVGRKIKTKKLEDTGRYFHPLLGALITGAARLMLALAERNALDHGLDWAFCDTDSLAIANTAALPAAALPAEEFKARVESVRRWFEPLNPYRGPDDAPESILQLEKVNFPLGQNGNLDQLRPINCLAISAKRYVLFDRDDDGAPVVRKASGHGLGYLLPPYGEDDDARAKRIDRIGVDLWQEDLWKKIIVAHDGDRPDQVDYASLQNFDQPAASRYAATNQALLKWFDQYNQTVEPHERVWPFNFLLTFQAKAQTEMAKIDHEALSSPMWNRRHPSPASRYSTDLIKDRPPVFDRKSGEPVPWHWLKSYSRALVRHHLHSEMKFLDGVESERGVLRRRHVQAWAMLPIGKEADNLEERETIGDNEGDQIRWTMPGHDLAKLIADIDDLLERHRISATQLCKEAGVSHHTLAALRAGARVALKSLLKLARAAEELRQRAEPVTDDRERWRRIGIELMARVGGRNKLAAELCVSAPYLGRVLKGEKPMTDEMIERLRALASRIAGHVLTYRPDAGASHDLGRALPNT